MRRARGGCGVRGSGAHGPRTLEATAYAGADDVKLALSARFQAHVAKPIEPIELARAVAELGHGIGTS